MVYVLSPYSTKWPSGDLNPGLPGPNAMLQPLYHSDRNQEQPMGTAAPQTWRPCNDITTMQWDGTGQVGLDVPEPPWLHPDHFNPHLVLVKGSSAAARPGLWSLLMGNGSSHYDAFQKWNAILGNLWLHAIWEVESNWGRVLGCSWWVLQPSWVSIQNPG